MEKQTPILKAIYPTRLGISNVFEHTPIPSLLKLHKSSYNVFLQRFTPTSNRLNTGLEYLLKLFFGNDYIGYALGTSSYTMEECITNNKTYSLPLFVYVKNIRKSEGYMRFHVGNIPLLTKSGSFIISGVENTIVNQLVRDCGIYVDKAVPNTSYSSLVIRGLKGRTIEINMVKNDFIGRKMHKVTKKGRLNTAQDIRILLDNINLSFRDIAYALTYTIDTYVYTDKGWHIILDWSCLKECKYILSDRVIHTTGNLLITHNKKLNDEEYKNILNTKINNLFLNKLSVNKKKNYILIDIYNKKGKSIFSAQNDNTYSSELLLALLTCIGMPFSRIEALGNISELFASLSSSNTHKLVYIDLNEKDTYYATIFMYLLESKRNKLSALYKMTRNSSIYTAKEEAIVRTYNECILSSVGRKRINSLLGVETSTHLVTPKDLMHVIRHLIQVNNGYVLPDGLEEQDLHNKKFSSIGEQMYTCLKDVLIDSRARMETNYYKKDMNNVHAIFSKIETCRYAMQFLVKYLSRSSLCQYTEQVNPLSYITHGRKVSLMGPGGLKNDNVSLEMRDVHISSYGRICPIETPEGKSVGVVTSLSVFTRVNKDSLLESPYLQVINGCVTNVIHYLTPIEEKAKHIALANQRLQKDGSFLYKSEIYCRYNNQTVIVSATFVDYIELSTKQITSLSSSMIPFLEHNDANRALMGSNMQRQAVPLDNIETTLVGTGMESMTPRDIGHNRLADHKYAYSTLDTNTISIIDSNIFNQYHSNITSTNQTFKSVNTHTLVRNKYTNQKTIHIEKTQGIIGEDYKIHNISVSGFSFTNNEIALGNNILIAFTSINGHTFEDSIVISERLLRDNYLQSTHLEVYKAMETQDNDGQELIKLIPNTINMDNDGVIYLGSHVKKDDILICKEKRQLYSVDRNKLIVSDRSVKYKSKRNGYVIDRVKLFENTVISHKQYTNRDNKFIINGVIKAYIYKKLVYSYPHFVYRHSFYSNVVRMPNDIKIDLNSLIANVPINYMWSIFFVMIQKIALSKNISHLGKERYALYYQITKHSNIDNDLLQNDYLNLIKELYKMSYLTLIDRHMYNNDAFLDKMSDKDNIMNIKAMETRTHNIVVGNMVKRVMYLLETAFPFLIIHQSRVMEKLYYTYIKNRKRYYARIVSVLDRKDKIIHYKKDDYCLKMVKIIVATKHPIQAGDKLTGRYGNKGVISRVMSIEDMPYLRDGTPVDIILSPLGVSSRMNIGQLFENYLGAVSIGIGKQLQKHLMTYKTSEHINLRNYLLNMYNNKKEQLVVQNMSKKSIIELFNKLSHGASFATQVFHSATNNDLDTISRKIGYDARGKVDLLDSLTGETLDNKITVGYLYIMKLNHLIDHKIHGRSTGPYNVVTQQASKGKSKNGGQRLGEMEVWALQAYGAAYTLQEMLTFKSDSTLARTNFLQQFIRGKSYKIDIPRTFKLLRDELRVLGMEISFIVKSHK